MKNIIKSLALVASLTGISYAADNTTQGTTAATAATATLRVSNQTKVVQDAVKPFLLFAEKEYNTAKNNLNLFKNSSKSMWNPKSLSELQLSALIEIPGLIKALNTQNELINNVKEVQLFEGKDSKEIIELLECVAISSLSQVVLVSRQVNDRINELSKALKANPNNTTRNTTASRCVTESRAVNRKKGGRINGPL